MNKEQSRLERQAIAAHAAGDTWHDFWRRFGPHCVALEPHDRRRFHALVRRLTALVAAGDTDGAEPIANAWPRPEPWELDDAATPTA